MGAGGGGGGEFLYPFWTVSTDDAHAMRLDTCMGSLGRLAPVGSRPLPRESGLARRRRKVEEGKKSGYLGQASKVSG